MRTPHTITSLLQTEQSLPLRSSTFPVARGILTAAVALTLWVGATNPVQAALLTGSGAHLTLPGSVVPFSSIAVGLTSFSETPYTSFSLVWDGSAPLAWQGTVNGTGPYTAGPRPAGTTLFNFSALNAGFLPTGTYLNFSDLDNGSGTEHITLRAFDTANNLITTPWLNDTVTLWAPSTTTGGGAPGVNDGPGYDWNGVAANAYTFDGTTVPGNPNINLFLTSAMNIGSVEVIRDSNSNSFGFAAPVPVPEPGTAVFGVACLAIVAARRRRASAA